MSESEDFLSRWSRLKRESGVAGSDVAEKRTTDASPGADVPSLPAFDAASLPPIESIAADSDVRPFLQACVPAELTRAALRRTWTADPAIRDFVGIADSQWDFNDPAAMPGFGSLGAADCARNQVARALGNVNNGVEGALENSAIAEQPPTASRDPQCSEPVDDVSQVAATPAHSAEEADLAGQVGEIAGDESVTRSVASPANFDPRATRSHGGALPK
jgi:hypothetical protein